MSEEIYAEGRLYVTRYCGPAGPSDRTRWQITIAGQYPDSQFVTLDREQLRRLFGALGTELSDDGIRDALCSRGSSLLLSQESPNT